MLTRRVTVVLRRAWSRHSSGATAGQSVSTAYLNLAVHASQVATRGPDAAAPVVSALRAIEAAADPVDPHHCYLLGSAVTTASSISDRILRSLPKSDDDGTAALPAIALAGTHGWWPVADCVMTGRGAGEVKEPARRRRLNCVTLYHYY